MQLKHGYILGEDPRKKKIEAEDTRIRRNRSEEEKLPIQVILK
jgi:hypothetical protein